MSAARQIRPATAADAAAVARLLHDFNAEYEEDTPPVEELSGYLRPLLASGAVTALLGAEGPDDGPAGVAVLRLRPSLWTGKPEAYLQELYVVPDRRGQGLGRALLEATLAAAREAGATSIDLNTGATDVEARGLYESAGFTNREGSPDGPAMLYYEREL